MTGVRAKSASSYRFPLAQRLRNRKERPVKGDVAAGAGEVQSKILVVEDDDVMREIVASYLRAQNFNVVEAASKVAASAAFSVQPPELMIVDVELSDGSGFDLARELRQMSNCALIYLTVRDGADDRIRGLNEGGDDYMVKPIDLRELLARVNAVLRRYRQSHFGPSDLLLEFGGWTLDLLRRELADPRARLIALTRGEFDLLAALVQARGIALDRDYLREVLSSPEGHTQPHTIDVMMSRIRAKLAQGASPIPRIVTERNRGYRFVMPAA